jgi:tetratricopeptide (TPR) repeat protein
VALSHEGIGTVFTIQERYPEALEHYEQKYTISKSTNDQKGMAYGLMSRGYVLGELGRYVDARASLQQASELANRPDGGMKALAAQLSLVEAQLLLSERHFPAAKAKGEEALALAGTQYTDVSVGARHLLTYAKLYLGNAREAKSQFEQDIETAKRSGKEQPPNGSLLGLAEAMLEIGDARNAAATAILAQAGFASAGQQESEWWAWLVAARATRRAGDDAKAREYASHASGRLLDLQQKWGSSNYATYIARPDVQYCRNLLREEFGLTQ